MISQNAFEYTLRWWPDQKPEFLPLTVAVHRFAICGQAKAQRWFCCIRSVPSWTCFNG